MDHLNSVGFLFSYVDVRGLHVTVVVLQVFARQQILVLFRKKKEDNENLGKQFLLSPKIYHFYSSTQKTSMRPRGGGQRELGERR